MNEREQFEARFNFSKYTQVVVADKSTRQTTWDAWLARAEKAEAEVEAKQWRRHEPHD